MFRTRLRSCDNKGAFAMPQAVSGVQRLLIQCGAIFWFALLLFGLLGLAVVAVLPWWMIGLVLVAGLLLGSLIYLPRWLMRRRDPTFRPRWTFFVHAIGGVLAASGLAALPVYYMAYWVNSGPTSLPLATLSNGKKTVVFQGMQHVASEDFYKSVVFDLEKALTEGYVLFYEGVQPVPGRPDLDEWFNKTLLGTDKNLSAGYTQLAKSCGLTFQLPLFDPLLADKAINPARHVTADVTYLDLKTEFERLSSTDPAFAEAFAAHRAMKKADDEDPMMSLLAVVGNASQDQKQLIGILCRGVLGMAISGAIGDKDDPMERIILDFRNRALARSVAESPADKIYITYGAAHFPGFLKELKALDPAFNVQSVRWVRPMSIQSEPLAPRDWLNPK